MTETYGYDKTPTPPRDYDVSKVPAEIRKRTGWVKSKYTGEDVAEAYSQVGDIVGIYADEAKKIAEHVEYRQDAVEQFNNQMIAEMTDKEFSSGPEIVQSRVDADGIVHDRLKDRLDADYLGIKRDLNSANLKPNSNNFDAVFANENENLRIQSRTRVMVPEWGAEDATSIRQVGSNDGNLEKLKVIYPLDDVSFQPDEYYSISIYVKNDRAGTSVYPTVYLDGFAETTPVAVTTENRVLFYAKYTGGTPAIKFDAPNAGVNLYMTLWRVSVFKGHLDKEWIESPEDTKLHLKNLRHRLSPSSLSDDTITKLVNIGLTYASSHDLIYGNDRTPLSPSTYPGSDKYQLDCSSFLIMVLKGVTYQNCRFFNEENITSDFGYRQLPAYNQAGSRTLANNWAQWAYDNGMLFEVSSTLDECQPGDIIFQSNSPVEHFWERIGHVAMYLGTYAYNNDKSISYHYIMQCGGGPAVVAHGNNPVDIHRLTTGVIESKKTTYAMRPPIQGISSQTRNITLNGRTNHGIAQLTEDLKKFRIYTAFIKLDSVISGSYPMLRWGDNLSTASNIWTAIRVTGRRENIYKAHFYFNDDNAYLGNVLDKLRVLVTSGPGGMSSVEWVEVYDGYISEWR